MKTTILTLSAVACTLATSHAASVAILNPGFETGNPADSWSGAGTSTQSDPGLGSKHAFTNNGAEQTLIATFEADTIYTFQGYVRDSGTGAGTIGFSFGFDNGGAFQSLGSANTDTSSFLNFGLANAATFTTAGTGTTGVGENIIIRVDNVSGGGNGKWFDEVSLDATAVPEPSSAALLGLGGLTLILRRRK